MRADKANSAQSPRGERDMGEKKSKRQTKVGTGNLMLKTGIKEAVNWEIDLIGAEAFGAGRICGDCAHLEAAMKDSCATLQLDDTMTLAVAIDRHEGNEAFFTTLLASSRQPIFHAQTIRGSSKILDESKFSIEFLDQHGTPLLVVLPTLIIRDYLPVLDEKLSEPSPGSATSSFFRVPETWRTATTVSYPYVLLLFGKDVPVAISAEDARELASELVELAEEIETRVHGFQ
jgi:hypothetical protein